MESPPSDDGFEHVGYEEDPFGCTDDEYEFVEALVETSAAPASAHAQPVGGGVIAAYEDDDDSGDNQVFSPPVPETITGCDQGYPTKPTVQVMPPHGAVTQTGSSPPPPSPSAHAEEETASPLISSCGVAAAQEDAAMQARRYDLMRMWDVSELFVAPAAYDHGAVYGEAEQDYDDATEEDEDDGLYGYYDYADFGRARRVKRSSGRRGRTKKASAMGRPRGEERSTHIAGNY